MRAATFVAACGGFESNIEWLKQYWGAAADNFLIRGTPNNRGTVLKMLLDRGVQEIGDPTQCHAVAIDARAPKFDGGIITRLDCVVFGIVVNKHAQRFYDEGEDIWPKRYAIWGRLVAAQPDQIAYIVFDSVGGDDVHADALSADRRAEHPRARRQARRSIPDALEATVNGFNAAVRPGTFDDTILDDCRTEGLTPPKTHWARRIETAPFYAYPVRPGITFTYLATRVNKEARMLMRDGKPSANMFAAGEIMAGNVLGRGYAAGIGMTIGSVFGRIAGREAAAQCPQLRRPGARPGQHATRAARRSRPADDGVQLLPLLRGAVRGVSGDGDAPRLPGRRPQLSRQSLPFLRRLLRRLPVLAAARVRRQRAARAGAGARRILRGLRLAARAGAAVRAQRAGDQPRGGAERRGVHPRLRRVARSRACCSARIPGRARSTG